ncbi:hypothetical protein UT300012_36470 [Paraclostridium bifermentans]|nr:hypothetical protein [Paraclostridium bifermentans]MBS5955162.1 hypothetical protein [Paraclostridium bifermentans]MBU5289696.1 hypothetical protein [Paraclostridium bifermentans]
MKENISTLVFAYIGFLGLLIFSIVLKLYGCSVLICISALIYYICVVRSK